MKKIILTLIFIVPTLLMAQQVGTPIFTINGNRISVNSHFINSFYESERAAGIDYTPSNPVNVIVGSKTYTIKSSPFINWDDPGFNVIEVSFGGQILFVHKQIMGLTYFNDSHNLLTPLYRQHSDNNTFIKTQLSDNAIALIFVGWPYDSTPCQLLIVVITPTEAKIVFNGEMDINSISNSGSNFSMNVQSNVLEEGKGTPITHTIWKRDGVLWFKNN